MDCLEDMHCKCLSNMPSRCVCIAQGKEVKSVKMELLPETSSTSQSLDTQQEHIIESGDIYDKDGSESAMKLCTPLLSKFT